MSTSPICAAFSITTELSCSLFPAEKCQMHLEWRSQTWRRVQVTRQEWVVVAGAGLSWEGQAGSLGRKVLHSAGGLKGFWRGFPLPLFSLVQRYISRSKHMDLHVDAQVCVHME